MKKFLFALCIWFIFTSARALYGDISCLRCPSFPLDNSVMVGNGGLWVTELMPDGCALQWNYGTENFTCASGGAPANATYLVVTLDGSLSNERNFSCGSGLTCADSGPNAPFTVSMTAGPSGWTDSGTNVRLTTSTDLVGIGTTSAETEALNIFGNIGFSSSASSAPDLFLTRSAANDLKLGKDAATASGQFIRAPNSSAGTGAGLTLVAGDGSGANTGGSINFQTAAASGIQATRWLIQASDSSFRPNLDNTYDLGTTSSAVHDLFMGNEINWNDDLFLSREAAATLQLGRDAASGTAQTLKAADGTSGTGGNLTLAGGDGSTTNAGGSIFLRTAAASGSLTNRWQVQPTGEFFASTDNSFDIGSGSGNRPRDGFFARNIFAGTGGATATATITASSTTNQVQLLVHESGSQAANGMIYEDNANVAHMVIEAGGDAEFGDSVGGTLAGQVAINGGSDQVQFYVQAHSTQTNNIALIEQSGGTDIFRVSNTGTLIGGANAATILNVLTGTAVIDFADPGTNNCSAESSVTVTGATTGDACFVGVPSVANIGQFWFPCRVSASNTCSIKACKNGSTAADPGSGTYRCVVMAF